MTQLVNFILVVLLINLIINVQQSKVFYFINTYIICINKVKDIPTYNKQYKIFKLLYIQYSQQLNLYNTVENCATTTNKLS